MPLEVRLAELPRDEAALVELQRVAFPYHGGLSAFKQLLREDDLRMFVLTADGRVVASMAVRDGDLLYYTGIMTHPDYRRQGLAKRMMQDVMTRWHAGRSILLSVEPDNEPAMNLYRSLGFQFTGERDGLDGRDLVMRLDSE